MVINQKDELIRAYVRLSALRKNTDNLSSVEEQYVREYHDILGKIENLNINTCDFRIPDALIKPRITSTSLEGPRYSKEKYVQKSFFLSKIDAILGYFEIITAEKPKHIGFQQSD